MSWTDNDGTTWDTYPWVAEGVAFDQSGSQIRVGDHVMPNLAWTLTPDEQALVSDPDDATAITGYQQSLLRSAAEHAGRAEPTDGTWIGDYLIPDPGANQ